VSSELSYTVREYATGDEVGIVATFNRVFEEIEGPAYRPRTLEEWRWQFLGNPDGVRSFVAVKDDDGTVLGQFAAMPHATSLEGERVTFIHGVDSFVHPDFRRGLKKPGIFLATAVPFVGHYLGLSPGQDVVMWGLPVWAAFRIGKQALKEEVMRTELKLVALPHRVRFDAAPGVEVEEVQGFPDELDALFERASAPFGAIGVRDRARLDWRFGAHPSRTYALALARRGGELQGYAVYRTGHYDGDDCGVLGDWLVAPGEEAAGHALRRWAWERAVADEQDLLVTVLPDTCGDFLAFQQAGFLVRPTKYFSIARSWIKRYSVRWLYKRWYYTLEESDLF
jgi:hypothetical protein